MIGSLVLTVMAFVSASSSAAASDLRTVDTAELHSMIVDNAYRLEGGREKHFTVIDARTKEEYDEYHIFSAISIPQGLFEGSTKFLPKDKGELLIVYGNDARDETCRKWAAKASSAGYTNVAIYSEGIRLWKEKKMPIAPLSSSL